MKDSVKYSVLGLAGLLILGWLGFSLAQGMAQQDNSESSQSEVTQSEASDAYNDQTAQFISLGPEKVLTKLTNKEPGIYYFGFPTCPWCRELLPVLDGVLKEQGKQSYSVNIKSPDYTAKAKGQLTDFFNETMNDPNVAVPFVVVINGQGEVFPHIGTLPEHNAAKAKLTPTQLVKLRENMTDLVAKAGGT